MTTRMMYSNMELVFIFIILKYKNVLYNFILLLLLLLRCQMYFCLKFIIVNLKMLHVTNLRMNGSKICVIMQTI